MYKCCWVVSLCFLASVPWSAFAQGSCSFSNGGSSCSITCNVGTPVCGEGEAGYPYCFCKGAGFIEMSEIITLDKPLSVEKLRSLQQKLQPQNMPLLALEEEFETFWSSIFSKNIELREKTKNILRNAVVSIQNSDFPRFYQLMSSVRNSITSLPKSESASIFKYLSKNLEQGESRFQTIQPQYQGNSQVLVSTTQKQNFIHNTVTSEQYPNPFSDKLTFSCVLSTSQRLKIVIFNSMGGVIKTICNDEKSAGEYHFEWNALDENGHSLPEGMYFCRIETPFGSVTRQLVHLN